ncbi:hypothetical protein GQ600_22770 [Phytophthora cactorum]|nr:hypothetical protein GQ600_22770 [Phytophthora cactorum]
MSAAQGSVSKLDVLSRFGYEQPDLLIHFANLELAGSFIRRHAFNTNKSVKRNKGDGNHKKWLCSHHESGCSWFISLSRKRGSAAKKSAKSQRPSFLIFLKTRGTFPIHNNTKNDDKNLNVIAKICRLIRCKFL